MLLFLGPLTGELLVVGNHVETETVLTADEGVLGLDLRRALRLVLERARRLDLKRLKRRRRLPRSAATVTSPPRFAGRRKNR